MKLQKARKTQASQILGNKEGRKVNESTKSKKETKKLESKEGRKKWNLQKIERKMKKKDK